MLVLKFKSAYRKSGSTRFVYAISSTLEGNAGKAELAQYKKTKGEFYREDAETKEALYFSGDVYPDGIQIKLKRDESDYYVLTDLREKSLFIEEEAQKMQGKLEGLRQYAGMSKRSFINDIAGQLFA